MKRKPASGSSAIGRHGESLAAQALVTFGLEIIDRNWKGPSGEIDLIARDGEFIVFVEVKTRRSTTHGMPEESISQMKQNRIVDTALRYLFETSRQDVSWRIDIVAIEMSGSGKVLRMSHYRGVDFE